MSLIIAATDFTNVAQNAVKYACGLAAAQNADVLILHSYIMPVMFSDVPVPSSLVNDAQADAETQMKEVVNDMSLCFPSLNIKGKVVYGDTIDILDEYEQGTKPLLIVVGNSLSGETSTWIDNTLLSEFKKLKYPVLAVPPNMVFMPVKKICLAFDNKHTGNDVAFEQLTQIADVLRAELHILNAQTDAHNQDNNADIDPAAKKKLAAANPHYHLVFNAEDTDNAILDFAKNNNVDWLVMIPRKHSFFEGLFHKSHTKAVSQLSHIPIVALHEQ